jgi:hypothetical protein
MSALCLKASILNYNRFTQNVTRARVLPREKRSIHVIDLTCMLLSENIRIRVSPAPRTRAISSILVHTSTHFVYLTHPYPTQHAQLHPSPRTPHGSPISPNLRLPCHRPIIQAPHHTSPRSPHDLFKSALLSEDKSAHLCQAMHEWKELGFDLDLRDMRLVRFGQDEAPVWMTELEKIEARAKGLKLMDMWVLTHADELRLGADCRMISLAAPITLIWDLATCSRLEEGRTPLNTPLLPRSTVPLTNTSNPSSPASPPPR